MHDTFTIPFYVFNQINDYYLHEYPISSFTVKNDTQYQLFSFMDPPATYTTYGKNRLFARKMVKESMSK